MIVEDNLLKAARGSGELTARETTACTGMPAGLAPELDRERNSGVDLGS